MSRTKTENEAPAHKYFTQMLNIAEDELDPFQYRLLAHYIRWTGHGGESDESIRAAAKATKMGVNKIRSTLDELVVLKYITVDRPTPQEARNGKTIHITIIDRWMDNIIKYQGVSKTIQGSAKPVSKKIHTPVSKKIRLEEQGKEEQKEDSADAPKSTSTDKKLPKRTAKFTRAYILAYNDCFGTDTNLLVSAWYGVGSHSSITTLANYEGQIFIETHEELERLGVGTDKYPEFVKHVRVTQHWQGRKNAVQPSEMRKCITEFIDISKSKPVVVSGETYGERAVKQGRAMFFGGNERGGNDGSE